MIRTLSAYVNVALEDYDDSMLNHLVELMKESLREQSTETILEDTWKVEENKRRLLKNEEGVWVSQPLADMFSEDIQENEILEVMTVGIKVDAVSE
ncbi:MULTISPECIES: hypothetical protein [Desulfosporosinus]|uniref:Uncharacterized protein n=1 Tax=Desulfosporosinus nitroreducens TaxID=2018668 RepID=A0ABT8QJH0_9FIRM|nr:MULTISPECIES: hypothetical protein [Desulfosporosinus]MCO1600338.1 hypothetical protein [Desulfosporosinus nitroreducens]MCO5386723.1 hypothetical protein [Desulfosporosinus sp.]MDA8222784.1 hypothetical protein [Desulfitobacterium hafniense]MDO0821426.1 hypothetical protein [Desulfosporosinus nitroreducens]